MNGMSERLRHLLASARGLKEPQFDAQMQITNGPENITTKVKRLVGLLQTFGDNKELRVCADILNASELPDVSDGLLRLLSHAVFDNPNTPLHES